MNHNVSIAKKFRACLQLLRLPNLFTVPGDPLAGFLLAACLFHEQSDFTRLPFVMISSILIYMTGLLWNDCADYEEDLKFRPQRPLPSGLISRKSTAVAGGMLGLIAVATASLAGKTSMVIALILLILVGVYDFVSKRFKIIGSFNMGLCRGVSVLLGASVFGVEGMSLFPVLIASSTVTLYIMTVTLIADKETATTSLKYERWLPLIVILVGLSVICVHVGIIPWLSVFAFLVLIIIAWLNGHRLYGVVEPAITQKSVVGFLRGILLLQAFFSALLPVQGEFAAVILILILPISVVIGKWFYST